MIFTQLAASDSHQSWNLLLQWIYHSGLLHKFQIKLGIGKHNFFFKSIWLHLHLLSPCNRPQLLSENFQSWPLFDLAYYIYINIRISLTSARHTWLRGSNRQLIVVSVTFSMTSISARSRPFSGCFFEKGDNTLKPLMVLDFLLLRFLDPPYQWDGVLEHIVTTKLPTKQSQLYLFYGTQQHIVRRSQPHNQDVDIT